MCTNVNDKRKIKRDHIQGNLSVSLEKFMRAECALRLNVNYLIK